MRVSERSILELLDGVKELLGDLSVVALAGVDPGYLIAPRASSEKRCWRDVCSPTPSRRRSAAAGTGAGGGGPGGAGLIPESTLAASFVMVGWIMFWMLIVYRRRSSGDLFSWEIRQTFSIRPPPSARNASSGCL
jgi:hypothetical protein